ncbi:hypothetical protein ACFLQJ_00480 [Calditrichota bacterium]
MMRDTVTDLRKSVFNPSDEKENEIINNLISEYSEKIDNVLKKQTGYDEKIEDISSQLKSLFEEGIKETSEARLKTMEKSIVAILQEIGALPIITIATRLNIPQTDLFDSLFSLHKQNIVEWEGGPTRIGSASIIKLI